MTFRQKSIILFIMHDFNFNDEKLSEIEKKICKNKSNYT